MMSKICSCGKATDDLQGVCDECREECQQEGE